MSLRAKLLGKNKTRRLALHVDWWRVKPGVAPHLLYANATFSSGDANTRRLLDWLRTEDLRWSEKRMMLYLQQHQESFRDLLWWLIDGACVDLESEYDLRPEDDCSDEFMLECWQGSEEVKFLQLHALEHTGVQLVPKLQGEDANELVFWDIDIGPRKIRDPLDSICWYLLYFLMRDGVIPAQRCRFEGCEMFFEPETVRKQYCSSLCRAKAHAKSPEEWRIYMRKYRSVRKKLGKKKR